MRCSDAVRGYIIPTVMERGSEQVRVANQITVGQLVRRMAESCTTR